MSSPLRRLRAIAHEVLHAPPVRRVLSRTPLALSLYHPWDRVHPFDREFATDTSGVIAPEQLDATHAALINCYGGSQPSIVRRALAELGPVEGTTFLDLGCGKGRVTIVASEFPFSAVIGVELSADLVAIARRNVEIVRRAYPTRPPIEIVHANVLDYAFPSGKLAIFMYHPFKDEITRKVVSRWEAELASGRITDLAIIYYNPVLAALIDASPVFRRVHESTIPYAPQEIGYGIETHDQVVIWRAGGAMGGRV